jgi:peptide/nickel transport system ATP-binding protein
VKAVNGVSFTVARGERVAVVGESGSGKSAMAMSLLRLLAYPGRVAGGQVLLSGRDLCTLSERQLNRVRGREVGTVFQDPMSSLDPVMRVSKQMIAPIMRNLGLGHEAARAEAIRWLGKVGIPEPERRIDAFPFEMSGGMRQRVMIAMALSCAPGLVIADEPTTALDVTVQAQIVEVLKTLTAETGAAMLFITHDLGLVARFAHKVAVMYAGRIVEFGAVGDIFADPRHPYTQSLLRTIPAPARPSRSACRRSRACRPTCAPPPRAAPSTTAAPWRARPAKTVPPLAPVGPGHAAACSWRAGSAPRPPRRPRRPCPTPARTTWKAGSWSRSTTS